VDVEKVATPSAVSPLRGETALGVTSQIAPTRLEEGEGKSQSSAYSYQFLIFLV